MKFKKEKEKKFFKMNLQFFAEGDDGNGDDGTGGNDGNGEHGNGNGNGNGNNGEKGGKVYSDKELQRMMAKEKNQGRLAVFREMGFEFSEDDVKTGKKTKETIAKFKKWNDERKDDFDKAQEKAGKAEGLENENRTLKNKIAALSAGVNADCLDDVIALASVKVTEDNTFEDVLDELKEKYPAFFVKSTKKTKVDEQEDEDDDEQEEPTGTGKAVNSGKGSTRGDKDSLGTRLAKQNGRSAGAAKSSFFKN